MRCKACDRILSEQEMLIDDELCKRDRSYSYDLEDNYRPLELANDAEDLDDETTDTRDLDFND